MRSYPIVFPSLLFYQDLSLRQCGKYLPVEQLVSQLPVKRFDISAFITGVMGAFYAHYLGLISHGIMGLDIFILV